MLPHYDDRQRKAAQEWSSEHRSALLGIPERSGVTIRAGYVEVMGRAAVSEFNGDVVTLRHPGDRWKASPA